MERTEKLKRTFEKFESAFIKFKEIIKSPQLFSFLSEELIVEVATKRFEYTFESMWQSLREYFLSQGAECSTPLACFREAFKAGMVSDEHETILAEMIEKRNKAVHVYDSERAKDIYEFLKKEALFSAIENIYQKLKKII